MGRARTKDAKRQFSYMPTETRRTEITDAAIRVLAAEGIERATTRRIAAEVGYPLGALHYVFQNKDELLLAVMEKLTDDVIRTIGPIAEDHDVGDSIRAMVESFWILAKSDPPIQQAQMELVLWAIRNKDAAWAGEWLYERYFRIFEEGLVSADRESKLSRDDLTDLVRFLVGGIDGVLMQLTLLRDIERLDRQMAAHIVACQNLADAMMRDAG